MNMLREFFTSSSGLAPARQGLSLGWVISALVGIAILVGAEEAEAQSQDCPAIVIECEYMYPTHCTKYFPTRCCAIYLDRYCERSIEYCFCIP